MDWFQHLGVRSPAKMILPVRSKISYRFQQNLLPVPAKKFSTASGSSIGRRWLQLFHQMVPAKIYPDCSIGSRRLRRRQLLVCSNHSSWFQHRRTPVPATPDSAPGTAVRPWLQLPPGSGCSLAPQTSTLAVAAPCSFSRQWTCSVAAPRVAGGSCARSGSQL